MDTYQSSLTEAQMDEFQDRLMKYWGGGAKGRFPLAEEEENIHKKPISDKAIDKLVKHTGLQDVPLIYNPDMKEENAYYVPNGNTRWLPEEYHNNKYPNGYIYYSDAFKNIPSLAHELGHAKDFTSGEYPMAESRLVNFALPAAWLLAIASPAIAIGVSRFVKPKHAPAAMLATAAGVGGASVLAAILLGKRRAKITREAEIRATNNAKKWMEELYKPKDLKRYSNLLDYGLMTYGVKQTPLPV